MRFIRLPIFLHLYLSARQLWDTDWMPDIVWSWLCNVHCNLSIWTGNTWVCHMVWAWNFISCIQHDCSSHALKNLNLSLTPIPCSCFPFPVKAILLVCKLPQDWLLPSGQLVVHRWASLQPTCPAGHSALVCWLLPWYHAQYLFQNNIFLLRHFSTHCLS